MGWGLIRWGRSGQAVLMNREGGLAPGGWSGSRRRGLQPSLGRALQGLARTGRPLGSRRNAGISGVGRWPVHILCAPADSPAMSANTIRRATATLAALAVAATPMLTLAPTPAAAAPPDTAADGRCYVGVSHDVFLGRSATEAEQSRWEAAFADGTPRSALPASLASSDEWLAVVVGDLYRGALDRDPDAGGLAFWLARLRAGALVNQIGAQVYGSPEAYARAGGADAAFVQYLYERILHRNPSSADRDYWAAQVRTRGRGWVAGRFFASAESRGDRVDDLYDRILGRTPDATGRAFWVRRLATVNDVRLAVQLASSPEARTHADQTCWSFDRLPLSGYATEPDVSADGRWVVAVARLAGRAAPEPVLVDTATGEVTLLTPDNDSGLTQSVRISDDGSTVTYAQDVYPRPEEPGYRQLDVFTYDVATGVTTDITAGANWTSRSPSISADGTVIAFESWASNLDPTDTDSRTDVFVHDTNTGTTKMVDSGTGVDGNRPLIAPDGQRLVYESVEPSGFAWMLIDLTGAAAPVNLAEAFGLATMGGLSWTNDGRLAVNRPTFNDEGEVVQRDIALVGPDVGDEPITLTGPTTHDRYAQPSVSASGAVIALADNDPGRDGQPAHRVDVAVMEVATGRIRSLSAAFDGDSDYAQISADGRTVVFHTTALTTFGDFPWSQQGNVVVARFLG